MIHSKEAPNTLTSLARKKHPKKYMCNRSQLDDHELMGGYFSKMEQRATHGQGARSPSSATGSFLMALATTAAESD